MNTCDISPCGETGHLCLLDKHPGPTTEFAGILNQCLGPLSRSLLDMNISNLQSLLSEEITMQYLSESNKYLL